MSNELSRKLGLARTPTFAQEEPMPPGVHSVLLDGVRGSFCLSQQDNLDSNIDAAKSWAWSSGVLHHVTMTRDHVALQRWDRTDIARYTRKSVVEQLDRFYALIVSAQPTTNRTLAKHAVEAFTRLRSSFSHDRQADALSAFLLLLGSMMKPEGDSFIHERAEEVAREFDLDPGSPKALKSVSHGMLHHFISGFRTPLLGGATQITTLPSLVVRHAGALVFQEAHFELVQRGASDLFEVPVPATVAAKSATSGVHFTPPGLARALIEQTLDALDPMPAKLTVLDAACGSGSILYETVRTLRDRNFAGEVNLIGYDESAYAVQMSKFLLAAAKRDWPDGRITISIEQRDSLSEQPWPSAQIVLMNPPFVSLRDLSAQQRQALTRVLGVYAKGRPDLSMAFAQRGLDALTPGGVIGILLPAGVLSMTYAQAWRRHLLDSASVYFLAVFGELGLFRLATVETGCVVLRKDTVDHQNMYRSLWVGEKRNATPEALRYLRRASTQGASDGGDDTWAFATLPAKSLLEGANWRPSRQSLKRELRAIADRVPTTVSSLFDVKQGALPAPRTAFIISSDRWQELSKKEQRWFRRIAENQNVRGGRIVAGPYIFYPNSVGLAEIESEESLLKQLPVFGSHLLKFKPDLEKRRGKKVRWWELGEDRKWLRTPSKKIVSSYFGQSGSFAYDEGGDHVVVQGYGWVSKWKPPLTVPEDDVFFAYVTIFNSLLFVELLAEICPTVGGGQLNLSKRYSERVHLPDLVERLESSAKPDSVTKDLAYLGRVITEAGLVAAPRRDIEDLVRSLYGL